MSGDPHRSLPSDGPASLQSFDRQLLIRLSNFAAREIL